MRELLIDLKHESKVPLYEQIYDYICKEITDGKISPGEKLPSTRFMAKNLQISRSTVELAYEQLVAEGYLETRPCAGYFACDISDLYQWKAEKQESSIDSTKQRGKDETYKIEFSPFQIDEEHFPHRSWQKVARSVSMEDDRKFFYAGDARGDQNLRREICSYLHRARGVNCEPEQLVIGAGNEYLLLLLSQILGGRKTVAMERYTYIQAARTFENMEYVISAVGMDENGIDLEAVKHQKAEILYVMPSHQFPLGTVMPMKRRLELLKWSVEEPGRYIIEDDHDSEFRYKGKPIPSLQGADGRERVIYIGTFSKSIAQSIRVSYMVLPKHLLAEHFGKCGFYASTVPRTQQEILYRFLAEGSFERHLNRMKKIYKSKQEVLLKLLKEESWVQRIYGENAGLHVLVEVNTQKTEEQLVQAARLCGVKLFVLSEYQLGQKCENIPTLLIGYGNLNEAQMTEGIEIIRQIVK